MNFPSHQASLVPESPQLLHGSTGWTLRTPSMATSIPCVPRRRDQETTKAWARRWIPMRRSHGSKPIVPYFLSLSWGAWAFIQQLFSSGKEGVGHLLTHIWDVWSVLFGMGTCKCEFYTNKRATVDGRNIQTLSIRYNPLAPKVQC